MRRTVLVGAVAALLAVGASGCHANNKSAGPVPTKAKAGGELDVLSPAPTINLDPAKSQNLATSTIHLVLRSLTTWQESATEAPTVVPDLATDTGRVSDGGKRWTYTLKPGLKYADGSPIVAADIKYGVERSFAAQLSGGLAYHKTLLVGGDSYQGPFDGKELDSISTPDDRTIVFQLTTSSGDWPWIASMPAFAPVPKRAENIQHYGDNPMASGPYQVSELKQGSTLVLKRNPNWDRATDPVRTAQPDTIVYTMGLDPTVINQRLIADQGKDRNAVSSANVPAALLPKVLGNPGVSQRLATSPSGALSYLAINVTRPPLNDLQVRQALEYAVNKKAVQVAAGGAEIGGELASTLITPGIPGYQSYDKYPAAPTGDIAKAKALLSQAGHASGISLTLLTQNDSIHLAEAQAVQSGLTAAGINVRLKPEDSDSFYADAGDKKGDYDLVMLGWLPDYPSATGNIQPLFDSSQIGNGNYNSSHYSNPAVDRLIAQASAETDQAAAQELWGQADRMIMADAPVVPLLYARNAFLRGSNVANFYAPPYPPYANMLVVGLAG
ncbi:ABC transporter substrate-binding protein [Jatrophihabitans sp.]|uniref:ABC transporter substrate-binding protein n=1 Tax=Jatrophihabitans sp. TaxID=1932789 RepID=UPI002CEBE4CB|nr:ABC transporter substrate-binding protein [Jatrophihabitans sp.]